MGSAKFGRFFCLLSEGHNVVGRCITYNCHMVPLDNTAVIKNNTEHHKTTVDFRNMCFSIYPICKTPILTTVNR